MPREISAISRRRFMRGGCGVVSGVLSTSELSPSFRSSCQGRVIDGHMHLEAFGSYWEGLIDAIIEHYDYAEVDKGIVFTAWTPSKESTDRTLAAWKKHPDRFIPFGHIRTEDPDWAQELERVGGFGWKGIKLHQSEISRGPDLKEWTSAIVKKAVDSGIHIVLIHLEDLRMIDELSDQHSDVTWIIPHMGSPKNSREMRQYCDLARKRANVYLDTSNAQYHRFGQQFEWAGLDKIIYASDGFWFNPHVERAKIEILKLPTPFQTRRLSDEEVGMILGGNLARILRL